MKFKEYSILLLATSSYANTSNVNSWTPESFCKATVRKELGFTKQKTLERAQEIQSKLNNNRDEICDSIELSSNNCDSIQSLMNNAIKVANITNPIEGTSCPPTINWGCNVIENIWKLLTEQELRKMSGCRPNLSIRNLIISFANSSINSTLTINM